MVGQTTKNWTHSGTKVKICSSMLLYSKEKQVIIVGSRLSKTQSSYNQRQDASPANRRSY